MTPNSPRLLGEPRSLRDLDDFWPRQISAAQSTAGRSKNARPASPTIGGLQSPVCFPALWNPSQHREGGGFRVQELGIFSWLPRRQ
jgi:hypothetical protein